MIFKGRPIYKGKVQGETYVTSMGISFFGGVDPQSGVVVVEKRRWRLSTPNVRRSRRWVAS